MKSHEPAFPKVVAQQTHPGLTKREWMATQILSGLLTKYCAATLGETTQGKLAVKAISLADTLITALNKETNHEV